MISMKMSNGGRVVIPLEIRQALSLNEGDTVLWEMKDGAAFLTTREQQLRQIQALFKGMGNPAERWSDELINERRAEATRE
ncbi:MAG: AbrB/MazE/SpoVT family DNA-binding domain-containing protein [Rhodoferax sp.]|nr:AbrB/MazE/SpoVT family DNA-binding domain-containing protein [Rhodoferax sp.]NCP54379.1 AbrB/MazE/SpoVT family DNA-binding domain-containing protein [Rhodoferax sp.]PIY25643.1 MAG: AbrB family transcriptional regulator [Comamonadaceae bacterium CG_4_10_14_3_um_filter_60_75]PJC13777.1 MAG: AbrB family transcriptional regulator [Comamonadaceae bacterium CG_4_9_14_0_8_um_filter_60_18]